MSQKKEVDGQNFDNEYDDDTSDPLHASDLFSKDTYVNDRRQEFLKYREQHMSSRDKSSVKIQQLF